MTRRLLPVRRSARPPFASEPLRTEVAFPRGRMVILAVALVVAVSMLLVVKARMDASTRSLELAASDAAPPPLLEDRRALLSGLFQGTVRDGVDGEDFGDSPSFGRLIYHVHAMPEEEFSRQVSRRLDWAASIDRPGLWRGEFVRVRGLVASIEAVKLRYPGDETEDIYRGFLAQPDGTEMVAFDSVVVPPVVQARKDVIDIEGVFYRTVSYESKTGAKRVVPYLIVRDVKLYQDAPRDLTGWLDWRLALVVGGSVAAALLFVRWNDGWRKPPARPAKSPRGFRATSSPVVREDPDQPSGRAPPHS